MCHESRKASLPIAPQLLPKIKAKQSIILKLLKAHCIQIKFKFNFLKLTVSL